MEEARRFLRYVIPGLVFIFEVSIYIFLCFLPRPQQLYEAIIKLGGENIFFKGFFAATSLILLCGGIGFVLSTIYHTLTSFEFFPAVDHRKLFKYLCHGDKQLLKIRKRCWYNQHVDLNKIKRRGGWEIVTAFWHEYRTSIKIIKSANPRVDSLQDITHSTGTMYLGSFFAFLFWIGFWWWYKNWGFYALWDLRLITPLILSVLFFLVHWRNYRDNLFKYQGLINKILLDALEEFSKEKGFCYIAYVAEDDGDIKKINTGKIRKCFRKVWRGKGVFKNGGG